MKIALSVRFTFLFFFKTSEWVGSVRPTTASLFVSHQAADSFHPLRFISRTLQQTTNLQTRTHVFIYLYIKLCSSLLSLSPSIPSSRIALPSPLTRRTVSKCPALRFLRLRLRRPRPHKWLIITSDSGLNGASERRRTFKREEEEKKGLL